MTRRVLVKSLNKILKEGGWYVKPFLSDRQTLINLNLLDEKPRERLLKYLDSRGLFYYQIDPRHFLCMYSIEWKEKK